jgi:hypothetical protein
MTKIDANVDLCHLFVYLADFLKNNKIRYPASAGIFFASSLPIP